MQTEHDKLIQEYERYKQRLSEYEKELYLYNSKIEEHCKTISEQIGKLNSLGVSINDIDELVDENGELDLTDQVKVRRLLDIIYVLYKSRIDEGMSLLNGGG